MADAKRQALAKKVVSLLKDYAYPFGGYLRDEVAGEEFKDIDLYFPTKDETYNPGIAKKNRYRNINDAVRHLSANALSVNVGMADEVYSPGSCTTLTKRCLHIREADGTAVFVDLVAADSKDSYGGLYPEDDNPFLALDADVNCLYMHESGEIRAANNYLKQEVVDNIKRKQYAVPSGGNVRKERLNKLRAKGYTRAVPGAPKAPQVQSQPTKVEGKKTIMDLEAIKARLANNGEAALYRSAGTNMTLAVKAGVLAMMKDKGADDARMKAMKDLLDSEMGVALISGLLGFGLMVIPGIKDDPRVEKLSDEFQTAGMSKGMDVVIQEAGKYLLPGIMNAIQSLPALPEKETKGAKLRIVQGDSGVGDQDDESETEPVRKATASVR